MMVSTVATDNPILRYLQETNVAYDAIEHSPTGSLQHTALQCHLPPEQVARAVLLHDEHGPLLAVLPLNHVINFAHLFALAERKLEPMSRNNARHLFPGCETGIIPPLAAPFQLPALLDMALLDQPVIYLEAGSPTLLVKLSGADFRLLHRASAQGRFSTPAQQLQANSDSFVNQDHFAREHGIRQLRPVEGIRQRLNQLHDLPPMHPLTHDLIALHNDPHSSIEDLVGLLENEPSITAQLLRNARSAYYNYPGEINTIEQAITLVLGFDTTLHTALGISALRPFDLPKEGPLGMNSLWRHAMHCAMLARRLCAILPRHLEVKPSQVYLAGLLHNFGFVALGHLLKPEYFLLNRVVSANPDVPITLIEKRTLGVGHTQVGDWLMQAWEMPELLQVCLREHHNETYSGPHALYVNLILLSNCLLKPYGLGDAADEIPPASILNALGITLEKARAVVQMHMEHAAQLDELALSISAGQQAA
jgi:HD-like signal output (HDOD) protein/prolyl-tRNA editing enzyme YbaK/EbsC (Cys-tRNA(Pro) deacylase)